MGSGFLDAILDALQRVPAEHKLYFQGVPFNKMGEILDYAKKYSLKVYSSDISPRIEACPFYLQKEEYHDFLHGRPELFAVSADPLGPHTGLWTVSVHIRLPWFGPLSTHNGQLWCRGK